jgi:nicotinate-nucleotide adenylyltransferase
LSAPSRGRRIALFGGTFDPIHSGHLAVARAAVRRFELDRVHFIPCARPPHKPASELALFAHRFAMVALACDGHPAFLPSLAEAEADGRASRIYYSVDTVRRFRRLLHAPGDRLFFLLGADSFLQIDSWHRYEQLLDLCDFIVAHRPGFPVESLRRVIPTRLLGPPATARRTDRRAIPLRRTTVHLLENVNSEVSATEVRQRAELGKSLRGLVPQSVEEYIKKDNLYHR